MNSPSWYALKSRGTTPESQKDWRGLCSKPNLFPYGCTNEKSVWALICSGKAAAEVNGRRPGTVSSPRHPSLRVNPTPAGQTPLLFGSLKHRKLFPKFCFTGTINCVAGSCFEKCSWALELKSLIPQFLEWHGNQPQNVCDEKMGSLLHHFCAVVSTSKVRELHSWDLIHVANIKLPFYKISVVSSVAGWGISFRTLVFEVKWSCGNPNFHFTKFLVLQCVPGTEPKNTTKYS